MYPAPVDGGLGVHVTLDLAGRMRFGPDVEWIGAEDYRVCPARRADFASRIRRYWPQLPAERLVPDYAGIIISWEGPLSHLTRANLVAPRQQIESYSSDP
nr:hypothetical protein [Methylosinus sp. PW1]